MSGFCALVDMELPGGTVYLTGAVFIVWNGNTYTSADATLGKFSSIGAREEGAGGDIPAIDMEFLPPSSVAITSLTVGALQQARVVIRLAEYDPADNTVIGTPDLQFIGQIDQPKIRFRKGEYSIGFSVVSRAEWLFERDTGNGLSSSFHKALFSGETGHDNATGLGVPVAWGVEGPKRSTSGASGGQAIRGLLAR
jgi:hypothetical protein